MSDRHPRTLYAATLASVLGLAACSGQGPASPPASSTATSSSVGARPAATTTAPGTSNSPSATTAQSTPPAPTPSPKTTTADPVLARIPPAARPETAEGAKAFSEYFMARLNDSLRIPEPYALNGLYDPTCQSCTAVAKTYAELQEGGRRHRGNTISVLRTSVLSFQKGERRVLVEVQQLTTEVIDEAGTVVDTTRAKRAGFVLTLDYRRSWVVLKMQAEAR